MLLADHCCGEYIEPSELYFRGSGDWQARLDTSFKKKTTDRDVNVQYAKTNGKADEIIDKRPFSQRLRQVH